MNKSSSPVNASSRSRLQLFNQAFQNLKVGQKILTASLITIALVVIIMAVVLINLNTLTGSFNFLVEHDQPVLINAARLEKLQVDMETGQRGFVITGKDNFLEPYNNALAAFDTLLAEEQVLVSDNPPQVARLDELLRLHNDWVTLAAKPEIALRRQVNLATTTSDTLQEILRAGVGKGILDDLRAVLDTMEASFRAANNLDAAILSVQIAKDMVDQETGQRGFIITGQENFLEPYIAGQQALGTHITELRALLANDPTNLTRLNQVEALANDWRVKAGEAEIQARRDVDANPATIADVSALLEAGTGKAILDQMRVIFDEFTAIEVDLNQKRSAAAAQQAQTTSALGIGFTALGIVITFFLGSYVARSITLALAEVTASANKVIAGDLSSEVEIRSQDEVGKLGGTFNAMTAQLRQTLEDVNRRSTQLATVAEVSTVTATILQTDRLLQEVVDLTKERFNLYHAHIYLLDESGENLVLTAGAGEPGRIMVAEKRSIPLDREQSLVARAAREGKGVTVNDVTQDPNFLPNPLLPDTRSELAVPMIVGGQVIGVFDVQSEQVGRFTDSDINIQTTLAAQIATSIQNVRSFEQSKAQAELETLVNAIGQKIQRAATVEETLQTAIRELGTIMGAPSRVILTPDISKKVDA